MRESLIHLYNASLTEAHKLADDVPASDFAMVAGGKNAAWLLGHLCISADFLCTMCGGEGTLDAWGPLFMPGTEPVADAGRYPGKDELLAALDERHAAGVKALRAVGDDFLNSEFPTPDFRDFWPRVWDGVACMTAAHEPYHLGQLQQWKRATQGVRA